MTPQPILATHSQLIPGGRLRRIAATVVMALDAADTSPPGSDAMGRAAIALAIWEQLTGIDDDELAIAHARAVAGGTR
jgi:hypothetical protein